jgi:hypothetical protein
MRVLPSIHILSSIPATVSNLIGRNEKYIMSRRHIFRCSEQRRPFMVRLWPVVGYQSGPVQEFTTIASYLLMPLPAFSWTRDFPERGIQIGLCPRNSNSMTSPDLIRGIEHVTCHYPDVRSPLITPFLLTTFLSPSYAFRASPCLQL